MSEKQRVLALVTDAFGGYGGIAQYNRDFLNAMAACDHISEIRVLPRIANNDVVVTAPKMTQARPKSSRIYYAVSAIIEALRYRPTIIFCGHLYHGLVSLVIAKLVGAKLISQVHGTEIWGEVKSIHRRSLNAADLVLTVSRDTRARVLSKTDLDPWTVVVLNNTVGPEFTTGDRGVARKRFGLDDEFAILTVARLDAREGYKGHDKIIPLIKQMMKNDRRIVYLIAWIGDDEPRLKSLAKQHGVENEVHFLGKVPFEDLASLYLAADLFALPSTGEGFGIAFLEAMASGTPALGLAVGGAPDALADGELGWCVDSRDLSGAIAKAVGADGGDRCCRSDAVQARFGVGVFRKNVANLLTKLEQDC